jgi:hypothetical protein
MTGGREPRPIRIIEDRWAAVSRIAQTLALALAGAWGFYTFVYQERIKPAGAPASLVVTFRLERAGTLPGGSPVVRSVLRFQNNGTVPSDVYAEAQTLVGVRYGAARGVHRWNDHGSAIADASLPQSKPELVYSSALLRDAASGGAPGRHIYLRPGDTFDELGYVALPPGRYQAISGEAHVVAGRSKPHGSVPIRRVRQPGGGYGLDSAVGGSDYSDFLVL